MDGAGIGFTVIAEARTLVTSIKNRIENFRAGPTTFRMLTQNIDRLGRHITEVDNLLHKFPDALPADISVVFHETFDAVRSSLHESDSSMEQSFSKAFARTNSSALDKLRLKAHRAFRATAIKSQMVALETQIRDSSNQLLQLALALGSAVKIHELGPKIENVGAVVEEHQRVAETREPETVEIVEEVYSPATSTPAPTHTVRLDFEARDEKGSPASPEGMLKHSVLSSNSSEIVTAAAGAMKPAYGVLGMAGVGKTVAIQGLGHDKDVLARFSDGIHYMAFGRRATLQTAVREISKIMTLTGARESAQRVKNSTSLRDAVDYAVAWFEGKVCLYLLDDLWPAESLPPGYLQDLRQLLRGSPESRMAISTRSIAIASDAGCVVDFAPRDPLGPASFQIFMAHATLYSSSKASSNSLRELRPSVSRILSICSGLPIALSVTGCAVALLVRLYGNFDKACDEYLDKLEKKRTGLGDEDTTEGTSLNAGILLSLEYLEVEFLKWKTKNSRHVDFSISDLYTSLCVLQTQSWVPISVLSRLWKLDEDAALDVANLFCGMCLASLQLRRAASGSSEEAGIFLHDLQLDFCQRLAGKMEKSSLWHAKLLNGYLEAGWTSSTDGPSSLGTRIFSSNPRPWWSELVPEDGYIHANLARHLECSGQGIELASLLLDARWTSLRVEIGGVLALKADFEFLDKCALRWQNTRKQDTSPSELRRGFKHILKAVQSSWGARMVEGQRTFQFQVCGLLHNSRKEHNIVDAYLNSVEEHTPKPYLQPVSAFFPDLSSAPIIEIPIGTKCRSVACSPCERYIAAGVGLDIVIAEITTGEILQRLHGHTGIVWGVAFVPGSKKIVSGGKDRKLLVWEWESSDLPVQVLEGHSNHITDVTVSADGEQIYSTSRDRTLRIWDVSTGTPIGELAQTSAVNCVALCANDQKIALGLLDGTLRVLDCVTNDVLFEDTAAHETSVRSVSFCPNGLYLATASRDMTIGIWNMQTWTNERLKGHTLVVTDIAFSPDGTQIASSSEDGSIRLWDVGSLQCVGISPKVFAVRSVSFDSTGNRIISGLLDGTVRIWDALLGNGSVERSYEHSDSVNGVSISQNGLLVAAASRDGSVSLWDGRTGEQIGTSCEGHTDKVNCVSFSPDRGKLVSGSTDNTLRLWDTDTCAQIGEPFQGHMDEVRSVSFSFDGHRIISGSWDKTVRIWSAETCEQTEVLLGSTESVSAVSECVDGCHVVCRDRFTRTIIWNRASSAVLWKSGKLESDFQNEITDAEAEKIIRNCGQATPRLWPNGFPAYVAEVYWEGGSVYSNVLGEKTLLANLARYRDWEYHTTKGIFATGLAGGAVAICKLVAE